MLLGRDIKQEQAQLLKIINKGEKNLISKQEKNAEKINFFFSHLQNPDLKTDIFYFSNNLFIIKKS